MLEQNKVDLVVAIVKRFHTAKVAFNVLDSGNNLFTEKPMAPSYKLGLKLLKKANDGDLKAIDILTKIEGWEASKKIDHTITTPIINVIAPKDNE